MKVKEGKQEEKRQIARASIARDMAVLEIAEITGLSEEDIREIMQALWTACMPSSVTPSQ